MSSRSKNFRRRPDPGADEEKTSSSPSSAANKTQTLAKKPKPHKSEAPKRLSFAEDEDDDDAPAPIPHPAPPGPRCFRRHPRQLCRSWHHQTLASGLLQDITANEVPVYSTIIVARIANITLDSLITEKCKYYFIRVQTLNVDEKWEGAPFASMVRLHDYESNESVLRVIFVLQSTNSSVKQVKYSSIILQPIDLRIDEETLMRLVPFWRTSLSTSTQSRQFYFRHFEIHPIKIIASFLPGSPYASYSSAQEALRSLLHSVIKVPAINNSVVELNGVLLTHALLTSRELLIKCAQHYSCYGWQWTKS